MDVAILYEYPFTEGVRTMLRLEHLLDRFGRLVARDAALDHHFALLTLFELAELSAKPDLKGELMRELDRQRGHAQSLRDDPRVEPRTLEPLIAALDAAFAALAAPGARAMQSLAADERLGPIRSRVAIPAGTCGFDLPAYHAWQHRPATERRAQLLGWAAEAQPIGEAVRLLLRLLRASGQPVRVAADGGTFQQTLAPAPGGASPQLLRLRLDADAGLVPEITAHRLRLAVRLMRADDAGRLRPSGDDAAFELTLCG